MRKRSLLQFLLGLPFVTRATPILVNGKSLTTSGAFTDSGSAAAPASDWVARSTAPNVIWAHNFATAAEVNNFRFKRGVGTVQSDPGGSLNWDNTDGLSGFCMTETIPAGGTGDADWWRPFSALSSPGNGLAVNDPAAGGLVSNQTYDPTNINSYAWGQGYYNHIDYDGANTDGHEFYIQARVKFSASRFASGQPDGKLMYLDNKNSNGQELVIRSLQGSRYDMYTNFGSSANSYLCDPQGNTAGGATTLQPGSEYTSAPTYWDWPGDTWVTMLIAVRPGRNTGLPISAISQGTSTVVTLNYASGSNPHNAGDQVKVWGVAGMTQLNGANVVSTAVGGSSGAWTITLPINSTGYSAYTSGGFLGAAGGGAVPNSAEVAYARATLSQRTTRIAVWIARPTDTNYTKIWDSDALTIGGGYFMCFDPGPFAYSLLKCSSYMNGVNATSQFTQKWGELIFSKSYIPCPNSTPTWFASMTDKTWANPVTNDITSVLNPGGPNEPQGIINDWTGGCVDPERGELILAANGGHSGYNGNEVYACNFRSNTPSWSRLTNITVIGGGDGTQNGLANYSDGLPQPQHGYNKCVFGGGRVWYAGFGGMPSGHWSTACFNWNRSTKKWTPLGLPGLDVSGSYSYEGGPCAYDRVANRVWSLAEYCLQGGGYSVDCADNTITNYNWSFGGNPNHYAWAVVAWDRNPRCLIVGRISESRLAVLNLTDVAAGWTTINTVGPAQWKYGSGAVYHRQTGIIVYDTSFGTSLYKISVPSNPLSGTYTWSQVTPDPSNTVTPPGHLDASGDPGGPFNGIFSKFNIIEDMGNGQSALVMVTNILGTTNTFAFKIPKGGL